MWPSPSNSGAWCTCVIMVRGPIRYGMRYSASGKFVSTTALHLRRGFYTLSLILVPTPRKKEMYCDKKCCVNILLNVRAVCMLSVRVVLLGFLVYINAID